MPTVPYSPVPTEKPSSSPIPELNPAAPDAAFGTSSAKALGGVGKQIAGIGDDIFKHAMQLQEMQNTAEANDAETAYMLESAKIRSSFDALQGANASPKALEKYQADLTQLRDNIGGSLSNPRVQDAYNKSTRRILGQHIISGAEHAASQQRQMVAKSAEAALDASMQDFHNDPNPETFQERFRNNVAPKIRQLSSVGGWSPEQMDKVAREMLSKARVEQIKGLAIREPFTAEKLYNEHKHEIHWSQQDNVQSLVTNGTVNVKSRFISDSVMTDYIIGTPDEKVGVEERVAEARKLAEKESKDPLLADYAAQRTRALYNQYQTDKKENYVRNQTVLADIVGGYQADKKPTTLDEVFAIGGDKARDAWSAMGPKEKNSFMAALTKNAKGDFLPTPERRSRYETLMGMEPAEFMEVPFWTEELPNGWQKDLNAKYKALLKRPEGDPRIGPAMKTLAPQLLSAGIVDDKEKMTNFRGTLQLAMRQEEGELRRPLKVEEVQKLGSRLLMEKATGGWFAATPMGKIFGAKGTTPLWEFPVPEAEAAKIKAFLQNKEPTRVISESQIRQQWVLEQLAKEKKKAVK